MDTNGMIEVSSNLDINSFDSIDIEDNKGNVYRLHVGEHLLERINYDNLPNDDLIILRHGHMSQSGKNVKITRVFDIANDSTVELKIPSALMPFVTDIKTKSNVTEDNSVLYEYNISFSDELFSNEKLDGVSLNLVLLQKLNGLQGHLNTSFIPITSEEFYYTE